MLRQIQPSESFSAQFRYQAAARPEHVVWGSNWLHGGVRVPMPNDGDLLDFVFAAVPDANTRKLILAENPERLYGWSAEGV